VDQNTETKNRIEVSEQASAELARLNVNKEEFLRISLVAGGCSGMTYQLTTDTVKTPFDDVLFEDDNLLVVSDKNSAQYLGGLYID